MSCCDEVLRQKYRHLETGSLPTEWKEEMWNTYLPDEIARLRRVYGVELIREEGGEVQALSPEEIRRCVNWIMFCLGELKDMGFECVW